MPFEEVEDMDTNFNKDEFFCQTCQLSFFSELNFKEHNLSVMHHMKYDQCLSTGGSTAVHKHFCFLCMKTMNMDNWLSHVKGKKHISLVNDMRKKLGTSQSRDRDNNLSHRSRSASISSQTSSTSSMRSGLSSNRSQEIGRSFQKTSSVHNDVMSNSDYDGRGVNETRFQRADSSSKSAANQNSLNQNGNSGSTSIGRPPSRLSQADSGCTSIGRPPSRLGQADSGSTSNGRPPSRLNQADSGSTSTGRPPSRHSQADSGSTSIGRLPSHLSQADSGSTSTGRPASHLSQADSGSTSTGRPPSRLSQADSGSTSTGRPPSLLSLPDNWISSTSKYDGKNSKLAASYADRSASYQNNFNDRNNDRTDFLLERTRHLMDSFRAQRHQHSQNQQQTQIFVDQMRQKHKEIYHGLRGAPDASAKEMHHRSRFEVVQESSVANLDNGRQQSCVSTEQVRRNLEASTRARASTDLLHLVNAGPRGRRERQQLQGMLKAAAARQSRPVLPDQADNINDADIHDRNFLHSLERDIHTILLCESQEEENNTSVTVTPLSGTARTFDSEDEDTETVTSMEDQHTRIGNRINRYHLMAPSEEDLAPVADSPDMLEESNSSGGDGSSTARRTLDSFNMPASKKPRVLSPPRQEHHQPMQHVKVEAIKRAFLSNKNRHQISIEAARRSQPSASVCSDSSATSTIVDTGVAYDFGEFRAPLLPTSASNPFNLIPSDSVPSSADHVAENGQQDGMVLPLLIPSNAASFSHAGVSAAALARIKKEKNVGMELPVSTKDDLNSNVAANSKSSSRASSVVSDVSSVTAQDISLMHQALELSLKEEEVRVKIEAVDERIRALQAVIDETLKKMDVEEELKMGLRIEERDLRDRRMNILRECYTRPRLDDLTLELEQTAEPDSSAVEPDVLEPTTGTIADPVVIGDTSENGIHALGDKTVRSIIQRVICTDVVDERSWDELEDVVKEIEERDREVMEITKNQQRCSDDHVVSDQLSPKLNLRSKEKCRSLQNVSGAAAACAESLSSSSDTRLLKTPTPAPSSSMSRASSETQLRQSQSRPPRKARRQDPITSMMLKEYLHASSSSDVDLDESDAAAIAKNRAKLHKVDRCPTAQRSNSSLASMSYYCPGFMQTHCDGPVLDLSVYGDSLFTCSTDGTVKRFNLEHRSPLRVYEGHTALVHCLLVSELEDKTTHIFSGGFDRQLLSHDIDSGQLKLALTLNAKIHCMTKSLNLIMVGLGNGDIVTVDVNRNCAINSWHSTSSEAVSCITVDMDWSKRRVLLVGSHEPSVTVHDALSGEVLRKLFSHCGEPLALICWPSQSILSMAGGLVRIHDYNTGKLRQETVVGEQASCLAAGNDGKVFVGSIDGTIRVFNWDRSRSDSICQVYYTPTSAAIISICVVPNGGLIVVGDRTGAVHVLNEVPLKQAIRCQVATCSVAVCSRDDLIYHVTRQHVLSCSESEAPPCRWANCKYRFPRLCNAEDVHSHLKECHLD